eukprot:1178045-Prorocentrum_minimum.AAC.1
MRGCRRSAGDENSALTPLRDWFSQGVAESAMSFRVFRVDMTPNASCGANTQNKVLVFGAKTAEKRWRNPALFFVRKCKVAQGR